MLNYQVITFSGQQTATFLQGQLTADVNSLKQQDFQLTAYCNPQGRVGCIGRLWRQAETWCLLVPGEIATAVAADFSKYALFSRVTVSIAQDYSILAVSNPSAITVWSPATHKLLHISPQCGLMITHRTLLTDSDQTLIEKLTANEWALAEIRAGIPTVYQATVNQFLPHDLNLPELAAVAFNKGCYKGQEIIARMHYRGQRKKQLYYAKCAVNHPIQPGDTIVDSEQKIQGIVVNAACNIHNEYELLAVLPAAVTTQTIPLSVHHNPIQVAYAEIKLPPE